MAPKVAPCLPVRSAVSVAVLSQLFCCGQKIIPPPALIRIRNSCLIKHILIVSKKYSCGFPGHTVETPINGKKVYRYFEVVIEVKFRIIFREVVQIPENPAFSIVMNSETGHIKNIRRRSS